MGRAENLGVSAEGVKGRRAEPAPTGRGLANSVRFMMKGGGVAGLVIGHLNHQCAGYMARISHRGCATATTHILFANYGTLIRPHSAQYRIIRHMARVAREGPLVGAEHLGAWQNY